MKVGSSSTLPGPEGGTGRDGQDGPVEGEGWRGWLELVSRPRSGRLFGWLAVGGPQRTRHRFKGSQCLRNTRASLL